MNDLLNFALEAHGGLELWNTLKTIKIEASIAGNFWLVKGRPDIIKDIAIALSTQQEKVTFLFPEAEKITVYEPTLVIIQPGNPKDTFQWVNPLDSFKDYGLNTPWLDVQVTYFLGAALWNSLNLPFLYSYQGFISEEIDPWYENGEVWRRLKVIFPKNWAGYTQEQIAYFGPDGLIRRHDYRVDFLGGAPAANYATNYQNIDGIIIPCSRYSYAYELKNHKVIRNPMALSIEINSISLH